MNDIFLMLGGPMLFPLCVGLGLYFRVRKMCRLQTQALQNGDDMLSADAFFTKIFNTRNTYLPLTYTLVIFIILNVLYILIAGWFTYNSALTYYTQHIDIWPNPIVKAREHTKTLLGIPFWVEIIAIGLLLLTQLILFFAQRKLRKTLNQYDKKELKAAKKDFLSPHITAIKTSYLFGDLLLGKEFIFQIGTQLIIPYADIRVISCDKYSYRGNKKYFLVINTTQILFGYKKDRDEAYRMLCQRTGLTTTANFRSRNSL